jgi:hypothetical protein
LWVPSLTSFLSPSGIYCAYNAFSKVDLRVTMSIPGKTVAYAIDEDGNSAEATAEMWKETHVSSVLRALRVTTGVSPQPRKMYLFKPLVSSNQEEVFLQMCTELFWKSHTLGLGWSDSRLVDSQSEYREKYVSNFLCTTLHRYFDLDSRPHRAFEFFNPLLDLEPLLAVYVAHALWRQDKPADALQAISVAIERVHALDEAAATDSGAGEEAHLGASGDNRDGSEPTPLDLKSQPTTTRMASEAESTTVTPASRSVVPLLTLKLHILTQQRLQQAADAERLGEGSATVEESSAGTLPVSAEMATPVAIAPTKLSARDAMMILQPSPAVEGHSPPLLYLRITRPCLLPSIRMAFLASVRPSFLPSVWALLSAWPSFLPSFLLYGLLSFSINILPSV